MMQLVPNNPGPHKWADAICAWARGEVAQWRYVSPEATDADWRDCDFPSRGYPNWFHPDIEYRAAPSPSDQEQPVAGNRQFHIGAQNDALFIISGEKPAQSNDYPRHDADRTCVAKVFDEAEARRLVNAANSALAASPAPTPVKPVNPEWPRERIEAAAYSLGMRYIKRVPDIRDTDPTWVDPPVLGDAPTPADAAPPEPLYSRDHAEELALATQAAQQQAPAAIPRGVYYNLDADNFYDTDGTGMAHAFYREWQPRCMEFPRSRIEASLAAAAAHTAPQAAQAAQQQALGWIKKDEYEFLVRKPEGYRQATIYSYKDEHCLPVYAAPQAAQADAELTDEQIEAIRQKWVGKNSGELYAHDFARTIIAATRQQQGGA